VCVWLLSYQFFYLSSKCTIRDSVQGTKKKGILTKNGNRAKLQDDSLFNLRKTTNRPRHCTAIRNGNTQSKMSWHTHDQTHTKHRSHKHADTHPPSLSLPSLPLSLASGRQLLSLIQSHALSTRAKPSHPLSLSGNSWTTNLALSK